MFLPETVMGLFDKFKRKNSSQPNQAASPQVVERVFELAGSCVGEALLMLQLPFDSEQPSGAIRLLPFLVIQKGEKKLTTIFEGVTPRTFQDVDILLDKLSPSDSFAVLLQDAYVTIDGKKSDCLKVEGHRLVRPRQSFSITLPYEPPTSALPLVLRQPLLHSHNGFGVELINPDAAFSRGINSHEKGAVIWRAARERGGDDTPNAHVLLRHEQHQSNEASNAAHDETNQSTQPVGGNEAAIKEMNENAEVFEWYRKKTEAGDSESMWRLGLMYSEGKGTARDYGAAMKWFRRSADAGNRTAFTLIAWFYTDGLGVAQDWTEVFKWTLKAAEAGDPSSAFSVGKMYAKGLGVKQDVEQTIKWMRHAAANGDADGQQWLTEHGH